MVDFFTISTRSKKRGYVEIYPKFIVKKSKDLMIRGGDFYAIWLEDESRWSTEEDDAFRVIDNALDEFAAKNEKVLGADVITVAHMWDADSGMVDKWHKYCQKQLSDSYHSLDEKLIFANTEHKKTDYASKSLPYPLEDVPSPAYDELMTVLYDEPERLKIEWAIGSIISGDSVHLQKFLVLYGAAGTGKSTVLNIIQDLFEGYFSVFDAKALGNPNSTFALEAFRKNPLVAIQHDGDLSRIEDNTRLNSLVSHEIMVVNEKFKNTYENRFKAFLFMGTNKPVKITDAKSGLLRRLIDVRPSGRKVSQGDYKRLTNQIKFELGGIANHCLQVYLDNKDAFDDYVPIGMMDESNDFYNFMLDNYLTFSNDNYTTLRQAWVIYKDYSADANLPYPLSMRNFKSELKNYFMTYEEQGELDDGTPVRGLYYGFKRSIFDEQKGRKKKDETQYRLILKEQKSIFDDECFDCPAQYATKDEKPKMKWSEVDKVLADINTSKLHYVKVPKEHIVIDFDLKNEKGEKDFKLNSEAAALWPPTYAEVSKGGEGIHLHYIYTGDVSKLSRVYSEGIEVKVFTGGSSLRRRLTMCNELPIATISTGLPLKEEKPMINFDTVKSEKGLRNLIIRNLAKDIHPGTKPSMDFIQKILDDAYESGLSYDVSDMRPDILSFAASSTNHAEYCLSIVPKLKWKSKNNEEEDYDTGGQNLKAPIVMYDVEVFPNLFVNCYGDLKSISAKLAECLGVKKFSIKAWQKADEKTRESAWNAAKEMVVAMINPSDEDISEFCKKYRLVGFNCRRYDNHILYGRIQGYSNTQLYDLSTRIISKGKEDGQKSAAFGAAYNMSYTDIWDYASNKQGLKKWEIQLDIHHQELGLPWDQPVPKEKWPMVGDYCKNDVLATIFTWFATEEDFTAREILADISGGTVNMTTNNLITKLIFGDEKHPDLVYTDLATGEQYIGDNYHPEKSKENNAFPGYEHIPGPEHKGLGRNMYRGIDLGFGGYVYANPGMYHNVAMLDVANMHGESIERLNLFGEYTPRYKNVRTIRNSIKHGDYETPREMFDGKLKKYLENESGAEKLSAALKLPCNQAYGITFTQFDMPTRDPRNVNNIVALRGALFMKTLQDEVEEKGYTVAHIKTDSIKIVDADQEIIDYCMNRAADYGYLFEHECTYDRICLVNDSTYIAKYDDQGVRNKGGKHAGDWVAVADQFQVPYVFKTLFSKEPLEFKDFCEVKSVKEGDIYLDMNEGYPDVTAEEKELKKLESKYKKGELSDTTFEKESKPLIEAIEKGHNYVFVGRVGQFCPIVEGAGGGVMYRYKDGKYYAVTKTKGYRWLESEVVKGLGKEDQIDESYYKILADDAIETIEQYGDFYAFVGN